MQLTAGTELQGGKYRIIGLLGQGGFGITYLATMQVEIKGPIGVIKTDIKVAVKEFFMRDLCNREQDSRSVSIPSTGSREQVERYRHKFRKEAENLSSLDHPHIVKVLDVFDENDTSYYVMEYVEGGSLQQYVKEQGALPEERAVEYICQLASALDYMHGRHLCHLDLKPGNIMISADRQRVRLIDFGLSKQYDDQGQQTSSTPVGISEGYAPMEQYEQNGIQNFSPATDIYSLGATFFYLLLGVRPPKASDVLNDGLPALPGSISLGTRAAIEAAMQPRRKDRPQSMSEFLGLLHSSGTDMADEETHLDNEGAIGGKIDDNPQPKGPKPQPKSHPKDPEPQSQPQSQLSLWKRYKGVLVGAAVVVGVVIGMLLFWNPQTTLGPDSPDPSMAEMPFDLLSIDTAGVVLLAPLTSETEEERKAKSERKAKEEEVRRQQAALNIEMVYVAGGTFTMGAPDSDSKAEEREKPAHSVTLSGYYIGKYEVTQKQWMEIMDSNLSKFKGDNLPVENVSWNEVQEFIRKLNARTGKRYRLPTEAEWEFAARGGNNSRGYKYSGSGSDNLDAVAWYEGNSGNKTHAVGTKSPNELGIYDMTGNVGEFCQDWFDENYYSHSPSSNPKGPSSGTARVLRGGGWYTDVGDDSRVSVRFYGPPDGRDYGGGFRLAMDANDNNRQSAVSKVEEERKAKEESERKAKEEEARRLQAALNIEMVYVAGGTFTMGASDSEPEVVSGEKLAHSVTLSSYYIGKYEVTQKQWVEIMGSNPSNFKGDNLPVENVSWDDIQEFIRKLNARTGKNYRLPTEAEWKFAARGGNSSRGYKYSGSDNLDAVAWYYGNSGNKTHAVGTKSPNELGIYDMTGNVSEWCQDWYGENYYSHSPSSNPQGPSSGSGRVLGCGSWLSDARSSRVSCRGSAAPDFRYGDHGFRLVLDH